MLGETLRVLTAAGEAGREHYPTTLFAQSQAEPGLHRPQHDLRRLDSAGGEIGKWRFQRY
jgi:hypothetical protein